MGKPSVSSRKSSLARKKKRKVQFMKKFQKFQKKIEEAGVNVYNKINKFSRENDNLLKCLDLRDDQIKNYQKEIYNLNSKLLRLSSSSSSSQFLQPQPQPQLQLQLQLQPQPQPQPQLQPQSPQYKTLADYFNSQQGK
jgi:hypothetical protein